MELFGKTFQVAEITEYVAPITELAAGGFLDKVHKRIGQNGQEQGSVSITAELIGCCAVQVPLPLRTSVPPELSAEFAVYVAGELAAKPVERKAADYRKNKSDDQPDSSLLE